MRIRYEGVVLEVDTRDWYQRTLLRRRAKAAIGRFIRRPYITEDYLRTAAEILSRYPGGVVIDVGSNMGATALPLAGRFPLSTVVAVDAHPVAGSNFLRNRRLNGLTNVHFVAAAIGDGPGLAEIHSCPTNSGGHRLTGFDGRKDVSPQRRETTVVPVIRLDSLWERFALRDCTLLKVDTEGYEVSVLRSAGSLLTPSRIQHVICEYGPEGLRSAGFSGADLLQLMINAGYRGVDLHSGRPLRSVSDIPDLPDFHVTDWWFSASEGHGAGGQARGPG